MFKLCFCCREKWISILHHITNKHRWKTGTLFHKCEHPRLTREQTKRKKWLKAGSDAHEFLQSVVMDKRNLEALNKLTKFCHTGALEVYHSLYNAYLPKRQHFTYQGNGMTLHGIWYLDVNFVI